MILDRTDTISRQSKTLEKHLQTVVNVCLELQPDLTAIILYGSFGRNEGSWYQDANGDWRPYNDYDLSIVSTTRIPSEKLENLKKKLIKEFEIKWIDLGQFHPTEMKLMRASILNYDFKNASKVIYGDPTVLDFIPKIDNSTLPMKEVQILFFTRLYTLLGSLEKRGFDAKLEGEASRFFRNQMAKAVLAVVDVQLLAKGAYTASYLKRTEQMAQLYPKEAELIKLSQWALEEKLRPTMPVMEPEEVYALYKVVHQYFFTKMFWGLSAHFGKAINSPNDVEFCMKWQPSAMIKRLWWLVRFRDLRMERQVAVMLAQSYIAAAWSQNGMNEKWLSRGIALLRYVDGQVPHQLTWDQARIEAARLRMEV